jgi:hypothetical protein
VRLREVGEATAPRFGAASEGGEPNACGPVRQRASGLRLIWMRTEGVHPLM